MDSKGKCLRMNYTSFILGVGATLTLMIIYQAADFNSEKFLGKLSFGNGCLNETPHEVGYF